MPVPVPPESLSLVERVEAAYSDFFWVPPDAVVVERPELVFVSHPTARTIVLHAATWVRVSDRTSAERVVDEVYRSHAGHRSRFCVGHHAPRQDLEAVLADRGYQPVQELDVRVFDLHSTPPHSKAPRPTVRRVECAETLDDLYRTQDAVVLEQTGSLPSRDPNQRETDLAALARPNPRVLRYVAYDHESGDPISSGSVTLNPRLEVCFLFGGCTVPSYRGRGIYRAVVDARASAVCQLGYRHLGVFAIRTTSSPILERCGFMRIGEVTDWEMDVPLQPA